MQPLRPSWPQPQGNQLRGALGGGGGVLNSLGGAPARSGRGVELYIRVGGGGLRGVVWPRVYEGFTDEWGWKEGSSPAQSRSSDPFHVLPGFTMGCIRVLQSVDIYCFTIGVAAPMMTADTRLRRPISASAHLRRAVSTPHSKTHEICVENNETLIRLQAPGSEREREL